MSASAEIGKHGEQLAKQFLLNKGLDLVEQNYQTKTGEIDLIMQDADIVVFVEVRLRSNTRFGEGLETVVQHKQTKLLRAATQYLLDTDQYERVFCRFDIISIDGQQQISWIKDAFENTY